MYQLPCSCGNVLSVEAFQAGSETACDRCGTAISIPTLSQLKLSSGDRHPFATDFDKLARTAELCEPPFDGNCHGCSVNGSQIEVPIEFSRMVERVVDESQSPIVITPIYSNVRAQAASEDWQAICFPLLLCHSCYAQFRRSYRWRTLKLVASATIVCLLLLVSFIIAAAFGFVVLVIFIYLISRSANHRKFDRRMEPWLKKIPLVHNALKQESEYRLTCGKAHTRN